MEFNFDDIINKIPDVLDYRRRHYYDKPSEFGLARECIKVIDHNGREGIINPNRFRQLIDYKYPLSVSQTLRLIFAYNNNIRIKQSTRNKIKSTFKIVEIIGGNYGDECR